MKTLNFYDKVYAIVHQVPHGRVTSYGRVAQMIGAPQAARAVGYALNALKDQADDPYLATVPWHRVINAAGRISIVNSEWSARLQAELLRAEGVGVDDAGRVDLHRFLWRGLDWVEVEALLQEAKERLTAG